MTLDSARPKNSLLTGSAPCDCQVVTHVPALVAITGGPGAGKSAVLEMASRAFCEHVTLVPEAASIIFGGGFPRGEGADDRRAAQRTIFCVQREIEGIALARPTTALALCDRGTLDGLAYWPDRSDALLEAFRTTREIEISRYAAVIHLRTPSVAHGYDHSNSLRTESAAEAAEIDDAIAAVWEQHPRRVEIASSADFIDKALRALAAIRSQLPVCCRTHA